VEGVLILASNVASSVGEIAETRKRQCHSSSRRAQKQPEWMIFFSRQKKANDKVSPPPI
jgi:hypothetical protein